jgi:hypothetical protein
MAILEKVTTALSERTLRVGQQPLSPTDFSSFVRTMLKLQLENNDTIQFKGPDVVGTGSISETLVGALKKQGYAPEEIASAAKKLRDYLGTPDNLQLTLALLEGILRNQQPNMPVDELEVRMTNATVAYERGFRTIFNESYDFKHNNTPYFSDLTKYLDTAKSAKGGQLKLSDIERLEEVLTKYSSKTPNVNYAAGKDLVEKLDLGVAGYDYGEYVSMDDIKQNILGVLEQKLYPMLMQQLSPQELFDSTQEQFDPLYRELFPDLTFNITELTESLTGILLATLPVGFELAKNPDPTQGLTDFNAYVSAYPDLPDTLKSMLTNIVQTVASLLPKFQIDAIIKMYKEVEALTKAEGAPTTAPAPATANRSFRLFVIAQQNIVPILEKTSQDVAASLEEINSEMTEISNMLP